MTAGTAETVGATASTVPPHPAKFSPAILDRLDRWIRAEAMYLGKRTHRVRVLDPFAGVGGVHALPGSTFGVEIEPEWAAAHPRTRVGDATALPWRARSFDVVCTSPCYGNRMADSHEAREVCRACGGLGVVEVAIEALADDETDRLVPCERCEGAGRNAYRRNTYRHQLGRMPTTGSTATMQFGESYRIVHARAWHEAARVLRPGGLFLLNVSDHIRGGSRVPVADWHLGVLRAIGFVPIARDEIVTPRNGFGANRDARVECELVVALRGPS